ncbi:MAG: NYN domain-containing protein [Candidatus Thorarchaeota archaeon]
MLNKVGKALRIISDDTKKKIAVVLDGTTISEDFEFSRFKTLKKSFNQIGSVRTGKIILDRQITMKDSEILRGQGFQEEIVGSDVDIHVTLRAMEFLASPNVDMIAIGTSDMNLVPLLYRIKKEKQLVIVTWEKDITPTIESIADYILYLDYLK